MEHITIRISERSDFAEGFSISCNLRGTGTNELCKMDGSVEMGDGELPARIARYQEFYRQVTELAKKFYASSPKSFSNSV